MNIMQRKISGPSLKRWISDKRSILMWLRIVLCMVILIPAIGSNSLFAQGVGISEIAITPESSSILELRSTVRGFLAPRMTTDQRMTLGGTSPAAGLLVYDTDTKSFWYWDSGWKAFASGAWGTSNQLLGMNAAGDANEYKTLLGTPNQIYVTHLPGQITLSTPQDIHTGASPTFQGLTVSGLPPNAGVYTDGSSTLTSTPPQSGVIGYWSRTGNVLSPVASGDHVTTAGNIYTTGTGAITSGGLFTGNAGGTISGGTISLNASSNFPVNIGTGNSTGAVTIGNSFNTITLPAFNQAGVVHNNASGLLSTGLIVNADITDGTIDLTSKVTDILPIANGGTNSGTPLQNHRVMVSRNGQIVEAGHLANGMMIVGKEDDEPQLVTMSGDITINNTGVTAIGTGRVLTNMLSDDAVTSVKIVDSGVATVDLADNSVTSAKITDGGVATVDLADNSVTTVKITDGEVATADLADNAVTTAKITDANVTPAKISPGSDNQVLVTDGTGAVAWIDRTAFGAIADQVTIEGDGTTANPFKVKDLGITTAKLADEAVTTVKLSDGTVTTVKLADGSVTTAKLAADAVLTGNILNETILSEDIKDGEIATADLTNNAVTADKIADGTIITVDLADNAVTNEKVADNAIGSAEMLDNAIGTTELQNDAVTTGKILDGEVRTADISDLNVTAEKLTAGAGSAGRVGISDATGAVTYGIIPPTSITGNNLTSTDLIVTGGTGATLTAVILDIAETAVTNAKMADNAIGNAEMLDNAVGTAEIQNNSVTYNKLQNVSTTGRLLGSSGTTIPVQEITLGSGLSMSGTILTATGTGGTVTSVGLSLPPFIEVSNSPVTSSGVLTGTLASQTGNRVFASPDGASGAPTFRSLLSNDIPNLDWTKITTGKPMTLAGYGITDAALSTHNHTVDGLSNVIISGKANNDILQWDGTSWVNKSLSGAGLVTSETDPIVTVINGIVKSNGIMISSAVGGTDYVVPNTAITGGTGTKISYDSKGLVTGGTSAILASADYVDQGTISTVLHGNVSGNPSWGQIVNADIHTSAGIADTKLATISTSGKVANSATTAISSNTAGTIVLRDGSGDFAAGTITANLLGNATNATNAVNATTAGTATNLAGGLGGSIPYQLSANTTAMLANGTAGQVLTSNGGTTAPSWSTFTTWAINGNSGTNPSNNFLGTTDNSDLVLRAYSIERLRIESATGYLKIGDANSGIIKATKELVFREDGDEYGTSILRLRNRTTENGAIFETQPIDPLISLVDFIFKTSLNSSSTIQRNIRFEARSTMAKTGSPSFHIGGISPDAPALSVGDNYSAFSKPLSIGNYSSPTAILHLAAGTSAAGTAPLKFTEGTNLFSIENGAVEYDGTNYFVSSGGNRYTLAKTLTTNPSLDFGSTNSGNYSDVTTTLSGAADGDALVLGIVNAAVAAGTEYKVWVSSANTITVRFINNSGVTIDPPARNFRISIIKY